MKKLITFVSLLLLCACVAPAEQSFQTVDGQRLQVRMEEVFWPGPATETASGIEPFPFGTALVVSRRDGVALTPEDEAMAYAAASAHCAAQGARAASTESKLTKTGWAFISCLP